MDKKVTIPKLKKMKKDKEKITMLTAYDYPFAKLIDQCDIEVVLVGDSVGNAVLGYKSTIGVTMDEMIHHAKAASKGIEKALLIGDMPFMSYNVSKEETVKNAGRFLKEAGCDAVKIEGGLEVTDAVSSIVKAGIPILGHIGLTPQTVSKLGGYKVQGKDAKKAEQLIKEAKALEKAGCFAIVLECVPDELAKIITEEIDIPTIGIGAGPFCDGQVLVVHDILGLSGKFRPKFAKQYADLSKEITSAVNKFKEEVKNSNFPQDKHCFHIKKEELKKIKR
jgi:3-methyl-2-oxobutanoate hydroxymethyltransferase